VATALVSPRLAPRREARRKRLLEAALRLFSSNGYHDTSVDQIVAEARTSKTAFYEHFDSKQDCFRELLEQEGGALIHAVVTAAAGGADPRDRLRRGIRAFIRTCWRQAPVARLMLVESVGLSPEIEAVRNRLHAKFAAMVEEEIGRARISDAFYKGADPGVFGRAVVGAVNEATGHFLTRPDANPDLLAEGLCRIFTPR
jgi:AcrR family transcriptional regulator